MKINTQKIPESFIFVSETFDEFEKRYVGFGKELYLNIKEKFPDIFNHLVFYKSINYQLEDSYAEYKNDKFSFSIQLDPLCEVIVLSNSTKQIEIGYWSKNELVEAINFIQSELLNNKK
ncbi:hypothetical protein QJU43_04635 [Pasteurella atlantica]|uniref:hypothetical protein n=1 Tax=Pasteurellaceae TaxID=712 RepID=UPI002779202A|nr:hypothetical protein [Pasteurella atlantica]MDP8033588.1 hypothetical protein [Pasteurella atlantica]MDP8035632.1 hypothetical protein [Pasteurella atlantica]MDP8037583.1 hypothetical protein [Pasteurella atlantica]MDP8047932.1 hypothetical protein [Pasteurella atlantica]MDP8049887.1 hypothetical protein [Pasteurella atlantica]